MLKIIPASKQPMSHGYFAGNSVAETAAKDEVRQASSVRLKFSCGKNSTAFASPHLSPPYLHIKRLAICNGTADLAHID